MCGSGAETGGAHAHMEAQDADFDEGPITLGQLGGSPVGVLTRHEGHVPKQPRVLGPWQMRQSLRPPMYAIRRPACTPASFFCLHPL